MDIKTLTDLHTLKLLNAVDLELARSLCRLSPKANDIVQLAVALTSRSIRTGHTCFPLTLRPEEVWGYQAVNNWPTPTQWSAAIRASGLLDDGPLVLDNAKRLYFRRYWQFEQKLAASIAQRTAPQTLDKNDTVWLEQTMHKMLQDRASSDAQQAAANALTKRVSLLSGGPGTGKTTIVASIVCLLVEHARRSGKPPPKTLFVAPTGKAASRLSQAVSEAKRHLNADQGILNYITEHASTIHQALGMKRDGVSFTHNAQNPLNADIVVADEASMIDLILMHQLMQSCPLHARILIIGDPNQLASLEAGSVLRDLVQNANQNQSNLGITHLTKTHRYSETSPLGILVNAIRRGDVSSIEELLNSNAHESVTWKPLSELPNELERATDRWKEIIEPVNPIEQLRRRDRFIVLTPYRSGSIGTTRLNLEIKRRLPNTDRGTPIIIEKNNQELAIYNGHFGMLESKSHGVSFALIQRNFDDMQKIAATHLPIYSMAYALSIHKSQGSEFDETVIVFPEKVTPLITRELLYTAVSRARKRVRIIGSKNALLSTVEHRSHRYGGLRDALNSNP